MSRPDECYKCRYLIRHKKTTTVLRKDGQYEVAEWFECGKLKMPLPTISKYNSHCCWFDKEEGVL